MMLVFVCSSARYTCWLAKKTVYKNRGESFCILSSACMCRVGQNRIYAPYMTVYSVIILPKITYTPRIYMVLANPMYVACHDLNAFLS